ncbi:MAG TPA: glycosyltransferase family 39 protein [Chloroflexota bacterium]|nr:glycosyltransferase family 39 protein [Chloroflexota bacterium]
MAHSTLILLGAVLLVALALRLAFTFRSPVFVTKDSLEYVQPGYGLVFGQGFELAQRRTPVYPAFIAGVMALTGQDLGAIAFIQHLLGVATAAMVFAIGCVAAGPLVGAIAGLLFALSSPQLIYEHYIITEPIFTFFLVASVLAMIVAVRRGTWGWYAGAGMLIGVGALTRPVAQVLLPLVPIYLWLVLRSWRRAALGTLVVWAVSALLLVPWSLRNQREYGTAETTSTGRFLISRSVKHERNFVFYEDKEPVRPEESPLRRRARQIAQDVTNKRPEPGQVYQRVRDELGLTEAQTDALLRDIALEAIRKDPALYLAGTLDMLGELWLGAKKDETLSWHLDEHDQPRVANQWGPLATMLKAPTPAEQREIPSAQRLTQIFRPTTIMQPLAVLFLVGAAASLLKRWRLASWLALVAAAQLLASTALVGEVPRYRYPVDPFIWIVAGIGASAIVVGAWSVARRFMTAPAAPAHQPIPATGDPTTG